jgi:hypothetical protein
MALQKKEIEIATFLDSYWEILLCLLLADGLVSRIFYHTKPIETFAQLGSVLFGHIPAAFF